jgi:putative serine protease PepD
MVRRTGQQGVPVIAVDDQYIVGFDQARLDQALASAGGTRPVFGAAVADASSASARRAGAPDTGAYVGRVRAGSPAAAAGLIAGDVIVTVAGRPVRTAADLESALHAASLGARVQLEFVRGGERRTAEAQL